MNTIYFIFTAKYVDQKMKSNKLSEIEIEQILDKIMVLFRFVSGLYFAMLRFTDMNISYYEQLIRTVLVKKLFLNRNRNL